MIVRGRRTRRAGAISLVLASALSACATVPALAAGEGGLSEAGAPGCPSRNPPDQLTLVAGTPQTTGLYTPFAGALQVAFTNSDGCAVTGAAGTQVTFSAPAAGASGRFSASGSNTATVGADANGSVMAPTFTADGTPGSYTVTAVSQYGSVSFSLTNTAAGEPATLSAVSPEPGSATVGDRFAHPLQVRVLDSAGDPVAGASVTFTLAPGIAGTCGGAAAGASFAGGGTQATVTSDSGGLVTSPAFTAGAAAGAFSATASLSSGGAGGAEGAGRSGAPTVAPIAFGLADLAGRPAKLVPGVGATQSAPAGSAFAVRLAVTVTDADKNPVPGALVSFEAPRSGAGGRFTIRARRRRIRYSRRVEVRTGACGVAVAPSFSAGREPGGYIVEAGAAHARPVAFALVNEAPGS